MISDLEAFKNTITDLKDQASACRQQETPGLNASQQQVTIVLKKNMDGNEMGSRVEGGGGGGARFRNEQRIK